MLLLLQISTEAHIILFRAASEYYRNMVYSDDEDAVSESELEDAEAEECEGNLPLLPLIV